MIVRLSVHERTFIQWCVEGDVRSCRKRLNRVGERTAPQGNSTVVLKVLRSETSVLESGLAFTVVEDRVKYI